MMERVNTAEELGLNSGALLSFFEKHGDMGIHALALVRGEQFFALAKKPWRVDSPHALFSLSKSFCSMAAGLAVSEGLLSYQDSVAEVLADCLPQGYDRRLRGVTLHHLLSMTSGLDGRSNRESRSARDWAHTALSYQVVREPGSFFHYNTMGTYLAGRMVSRRAGQGLRDYLQPRLFDKLGISKPQWDCCPLGHCIGGSGLHLGVMDLARAAGLLLNRGVLGGGRILPQTYLERATRKQADCVDLDSAVPHPDWSSGYGYQFWMSKQGRYRGDGMYGQVMMVDEKNNLALCCTAGLNLMGDEMDALHGLMDGLLAGAGAGGSGLEAALEALLAENEPPDEGGDLNLEGSYETEDGERSLRAETPDRDTLRLFYRVKGQERPLVFTFGRKAAHRGDFLPFAYGERPQPYLGRFGVSKRGEVSALMLTPEGPYTLSLRLSPAGEGLRLKQNAVGLAGGAFDFRRADGP